MKFAVAENRETGSMTIDVFDIIGSGMFFEGVTARAVAESLKATKAKAISVRIDSIGGIVNEARAIHSMLRERARSGASVTTSIIGLAASAATIIADAGDKVEIARGAYFMVHESSAGTPGRGTADDHGKSVDMLRKVDEDLVTMYAEASALRGKNKTADEFRAEMKRERYFTADEAVEWGLADATIEDVRIAACADVSAFTSAPQALRDRLSEVSAVAREGRNDNPVAVASADHQRPAKGAKDSKMNKDELKAQHPDLYAAVLNEGKQLGETEGVTKGAAQERKRVSALLTLGDNSGAHKVARDAIASGASSMDEEVFAAFQSAAMNRRDTKARQADSDAAGAAVDGAGGNGSEGGDGGPKSLVDVFAADLLARKKSA